MSVSILFNRGHYKIDFDPCCSTFSSSSSVVMLSPSLLCPSALYSLLLPTLCRLYDNLYCDLTYLIIATAPPSPSIVFTYSSSTRLCDDLKVVVLVLGLFRLGGRDILYIWCMLLITANNKVRVRITEHTRRIWSLNDAEKRREKESPGGAREVTPHLTPGPFLINTSTAPGGSVC